MLADLQSTFYHSNVFFSTTAVYLRISSSAIFNIAIIASCVEGLQFRSLSTIASRSAYYIHVQSQISEKLAAIGQ